MEKHKELSYQKIILSLFLFVLFSDASIASTTSVFVSHNQNIEIDPESSSIQVTNIIEVQRSGNDSDTNADKNELTFTLHSGLEILSSDVTVTKIDTKDSELPPVSTHQIILEKQQKQFTLSYQGKIYHSLQQPSEESARSFSQTPGLISPEGVFLARSTKWYPIFSDDELVTFTLSVKLPAVWQSVSQGQRTILQQDDDYSVIQWQESNPQDDIYLTAGKYKIYEQSAGAVQAMAFLLNDDAGLAQKYLDVTSQYINLYTRLLGPYPYKKFALVENFWETGYGMPSFTLLGPKVIRFPFILHSSYPHEILHNWWGNSVYIDYEKGNWAEGLTAYLADHLIKQQRKQGDEYRRSVLQKYTDYVSKEKDFPLTEFRSRHSSATEAVGYGKTLMMFHMLRNMLGDDDFVRGLRLLYRKHKFQMAAYEDVVASFNEISDKPLQTFFDQWITRSGAPQLKISTADMRSEDTRYKINLKLEQTQQGEPFQIDIPYAIQTEKGQVVQSILSMSAKDQTYEVNVSEKPVKLHIDPEFDVFRRLDHREIPAAFSQGFGAEDLLMVLPSNISSSLQSAYKELAMTWQKTLSEPPELVFDNEIKQLPTNRTIWLLGWENKWIPALAHSKKNKGISEDQKSFTINNNQYKKDKHSLVYSLRHPENIQQSILVLATQNQQALPGLARKLPHYRKYSYLVFKGDEPENISKGQWQLNSSPMMYSFSETRKDRQQEKLKLPPTHALADMPLVFSQARMMQDINYLASTELQGRGLGSAGLDKSAKYIASEFEKAGLLPAGDHGMGYYQQWAADVGKPLGTILLKNVVAVLPGINHEINKESIIISAHYDHLGLGWPDVHTGDEGKIHFGADDNASGVAVMLELARQIAKKWQPERSIVFIAFTGEEAGHLGSSHYAESDAKYPVNKVAAILNLDTVGRLGKNPVTIFGTGSASELIHVFRGAGYVTGVPVTSVKDDFGASDQKPFLDKGIPAVQFFASAHEDFHRPSDTVEKIDAAGLVKVAAILKEAAEYLSNRKEKLTITLDAHKSNKVSSNAKSSDDNTKTRRVKLGSVPDFAYEGDGIRLDGVVKDSPADKAKLQKGDIIIELNGQKLKRLSDLSNVLKSLQPGDLVTVIYLRNSIKTVVDVIVEAR